MLPNKTIFFILLIIPLAWLSGSLGGFTKQQVRYATEVSVPDCLKYKEPQFTPITVRTQPDLNGFIVSTKGLKSDLAKAGIMESKQGGVAFFVLIAGKENFYSEELHRYEKEFILLGTTTEPIKKDKLRLRVRNAAYHSMEVDALPVDDNGDLVFSGQTYFGVLVERTHLATFAWDDTTYVTSIDGESEVEAGSEVESGSAYIVLYTPSEGAQINDKKTPTLEDASYTLLVKKSLDEP